MFWYLGCWMFIIILGSWGLASFLTKFKLTWKTVTLWALCIAICSDLALLQIDNQDLPSVSCCYIFPVLGGKMGQKGHCPSQICVKEHFNANLWSVFYLKAYLWCSEHLLRSQMDLRYPIKSLVITGSTCQCVKIISFIKESFNHYQGVHVSGYSVGYHGFGRWCLPGVHSAGSWLGLMWTSFFWKGLKSDTSWFLGKHKSISWFIVSNFFMWS